MLFDNQPQNPLELVQRGRNQSSVVILSEAKNLLFGGPEILRFAQNDKLKSAG